MLKKHRTFTESKRKHILLITNHGCQAPTIDVTTDTGGQCFYVNSQAEALTKLGYKVTILNRGGYNHPVTDRAQRGVVYYDKVWGGRGKWCRLVYLEDRVKGFVRKEDLTERNLSAEADFFFTVAKDIRLKWKDIYFINSHYWDGGILGCMLAKRITAQKKAPVPHIWTPHSLGKLKKKNYRRVPAQEVKKFNFPYRIREEAKIIRQCDGVVATSNAIQQSLAEYPAAVKNYLWMPPGINADDFTDRRIRECRSALTLLRKTTGLTEKKVKNLLKTKVVFLEISRTAKTKKKDTLLKAFGMIRNRENAVLILNADQENPLYNNLRKIRSGLKNRNNVILLDHFISDTEVTQLFALANVYITASVMEGWGMSVQQAAASRCAIISSKHVPFVKEALREDALLVMKNVSRLYAEKIDILVNEPNFRNFLAAQAYSTSKENTWENLSAGLIEDLKKMKLLR